jgi:glycosyltransferase involved in cell wall biosynthesis
MTNTDNHSQFQQTDGTENTTEASANAPGPHLQATTERKQSGQTGRADVFMLLLAVLLVGAYFRFLNVDWDEGEHLHPDERYMTMVTGAIRSPGSVDAFQNSPDGCASWGSYFDSYCSPLNPYNHQGYGSYAYGTFPLFTARIVGEWLNGACTDPTDLDGTPSNFLRLPKQWAARLLFSDAEDCAGARFTDYGHLHLLGRLLSALADLGTLLLLFFIGRRLYSPWVGLLAAALYALTALPIQQSHFYTVDSFATFWIAAAGYFTVRIAQDGRWRDFILAGLSLGLALASKVSVWPFAAVIVLAALLYYVHSRSSSATVPSGTQQAENGANQVLDWLMILVLIILFVLIGAIALFGIWSAVKIAFLFAIALLVIGAIAFYILRPGDVRDSNVEGNKKPISVDGLLLRLVVAAFVAFLAFRVTQPYAFVGSDFDAAKWETPEYQWLRGNVPEVWYTLNEKLPEPIRALLLPDPRFISTLGSVNKQLTGEADVPWGHQWTNRLPFIFPWGNMVFWGMGLALGLIVWIGWAVAGWDLWHGKRRMQHFIPWAWITLLFFYQGTQWVKSIRYLLPIYPYLILLGAWLLVRLWQKARAKLRARDERRLLSLGYRIPLLFVLFATLLWAWGFTRIYTQPVTRNTASRWMVDNIPTAATLHYEVNREPRTQYLRLPPTHTYTDAASTHIAPFVLPYDGIVTGITFTHLGDPDLDAAPESFQVVLATDAAGQDIIARAERTINLEQSKHQLGDEQLFPLGPAQIRGENEYFLITEATAGAPVRLNTTVIANEYPDDSLPTRVDGQDPLLSRSK